MAYSMIQQLAATLISSLITKLKHTFKEKKRVQPEVRAKAIQIIPRVINGK